MKKHMKQKISLFLMITMLLGMAIPVSAAEETTTGLQLSTNSVTLSEGAVASVSATLPAGMDASQLTYYVADPSIVTVTPAGAYGNIAAFTFSFAGNGSTVVAIFHAGNQAVVGYVTVTASQLIMDIPNHLGENKDNYCSMTNVTFEPYDFKWADFNDYKYTMKFSFKCDSYEDTDFKTWGTYGYFYDATGNIISTVHLYAKSISKDRTYNDECNVPVNAVRFEVIGW